MKKETIIYNNLISQNFFKDLFKKNTFIFKPVTDLFNNRFEDQDSIIIYIKKEDGLEPNFKNLNKKYLLISNLTNLNKNLYDNIINIPAPIPVDRLRYHIEKFLLTKKIYYKNIIISEKELVNKLNKKNCYLTDIEMEILIYLIQSTNCTKEYIKKNILNLKTTIQTNSIESHLTRIRKKLDKIETGLKINTKSDRISIGAN